MNSDGLGELSEIASLRDWCRRALSKIVAEYPSDADRLGDLRSLLEMGIDLRSRQAMPGHLTASAMLLAPDRSAVLLVHHRALGRWLQPGGHLEAGEFPLEAARREVAEEVGLESIELLPAFDGDPSLPLDIDSHPIPASRSRSEPAHMHHDFVYAMAVPAGHSAALRPQDSEVSNVRWMAFDGRDSQMLPPSLRRAVRRLRG